MGRRLSFLFAISQVNKGMLKVTMIGVERFSSSHWGILQSVLGVEVVAF